MTREEACLKLHDLAKAELGIKEVSGAGANKRIIEYHSSTSLKATSDEVPWCSAFANFIVEGAGFQGTKSAAAKSWVNWGYVLDKPIKGCLVILPRKTKDNPNSAHVTFCDHPDISNGIIRCIGGNQSDAVSVSRFKIDQAIYRSPI